MKMNETVVGLQDDIVAMMAEAGLVTQHGPFLLTTHAAMPTGTPTYQQWQDAVEWCQRVEKASPFWVGDLLAYGEIHWDDKVSQVLEATDYALKTCQNAKYTCKAIPPERRNPSVPFWHHHVIAAVPTVEEQDHWIQKCATEHLTRDELVVQIKAAKGVATGTPVQLWVVVSCTDVNDQQLLADRMKLEGRSVKIHAKES